MNAIIEQLISEASNEHEVNRILRARDMIENGVRVERINRNYILVQSATQDGTLYMLDSTGCPCEDHKNRSITCKHMYAAIILHMVKKAQRRAKAA